MNAICILLSFTLGFPKIIRDVVIKIHNLYHYSRGLSKIPIFVQRLICDPISYVASFGKFVSRYYFPLFEISKEGQKVWQRLLRNLIRFHVKRAVHNWS